MRPKLVQAPASLLQCPGLAANAKLVWLVAQLRPSGAPLGTTWLSRLTGLTRPTVLRCVAGLRAAGWDPALGQHAPADQVVPVPADLLTDTRLGAQSRVLYGNLLLVPGYQHPSGSVSFAELGAMAQVSRNTAEQALMELVRAEWLMVERKHRLARIRFELTLPGLEHELNAVARAQYRLELAEHAGEALMREYLTLLIDSDDYEDNSAPGYLLRTKTDGRLEVDRLYPSYCGFEYNGPQHYHATERYSEAQVKVQQERDLVKYGICATRGLPLVIVHPDDLSLKGMQAKVGSRLPLRDLTNYALLIDYLEEESEVHRRRVAKRYNRLPRGA